MPLTLTPINETFAAVVTDVDLANLDEETWLEIQKIFLIYGVLVFPGQNLSADAQGEFGQRFGDIEQLSPKQTTSTILISNQRPDGSLVKHDDPGFRLLRGNEGWHTDSTYMPLASKVAMLAAVVVPAEDGETEFADMRAAWDALDKPTQDTLETYSAYHSLYYSQSKAGFEHTTDNMYGFHNKGAPLRPVIKRHPETGRKSIYTGRHAYGIPGMDEGESEVFLDDLLKQACQPPRIYTHTWQVGDLVLWDNRCVMHRARPYNPEHARVLRGTRISGEAESELAPTFADARAKDFQVSSSNESSLLEPVSR